MRQNVTTLDISTQGAGLYEFTASVRDWLDDCGVADGLVTVFCRHTSASLTVQENADPDVMRDLQDFFAALAPQDARRYRHASEGPDDMPAHIKSALTDVSLSIPLVNGRLALGTWQGLYLFEHRARGHRREVVVQVMGD